MVVKDDYVRLGDDDNVYCVHTCRVDPFFATLSMRQRCAELMEIGFFLRLNHRKLYLKMWLEFEHDSKIQRVFCGAQNVRVISYLWKRKKCHQKRKKLMKKMMIQN